MGIDIKIHIDLSARQQKIMRAAVVGGVVIGALGIGIAIAAPQQWTSGQTLQASALNDLAVVTNGSVSYSVGATKYCGTGPTSTTGAISYNSATGYAGAKAMCQASSGCGSSATAHMCTTEELTRSAQIGIAIPDGWYSASIYAVSIASSNLTSADCYGWTSASGNGLGGPNWATSPSAPSSSLCSTSLSILCCD